MADANPTDEPDPLGAAREGDVAVFQPQAPRALTAHWISELITGSLLALGAFLAEHYWLLPSAWWPLEHTWVAWIGCPLVVLQALVLPPLWYRAWSYAVREHDIVIRSGILWRSQRAIPRRRIQHADIQSGPIDRWLGLCALMLYTAGTGVANAGIPGLTREAAERISDQLLRPDAPRRS